MNIEELDLSVRTYNVLKRAGIDTVEQLRLIFGVHEEVCNQTDYKIQRLLLRIAGEDD